MVSIPRCCFVSLRGNGVQDHSLLTDLCLSSWILLLASWISLELCPVGFLGCLPCALLQHVVPSWFSC